ncbi:hydroxysqualene dehydroxylase HpnE [Rhodoferax mekongensis]|uniref:Hydroxysqualene dehydroxylase HpnE n=1 Tax=Rhodoferax mekongensis TaxID=3068341 RepID=A0ABZ0AY18_9BURK|nr:hydroxysqualene dehydroxylase HpnE [Rhodoferax sp. TBRC 17307]WNO04066.1 hydroxysqualene dehydroxylase HpnE [Rhodoferax sp. TBRC 17307]
MRIAIVGAGWAGMAAAVTATLAGHRAIVFEAARAVGGRARALSGTLPDGTPVVLDNGQHILIGAYTRTLELMRTVGVDPATHLKRLPLDLRFGDGEGLALPMWPSPLDALAGIATARGWTWADRWSLLRASVGWQLAGFQCAPGTSVAELCRTLSPTIQSTLIAPLCVSALNTPAERACGQVFLTVLRDSLFGGRGSSNLLLPTRDLSSLFPAAAAEWLVNRGGELRTGVRVTSLQHGNTWLVNGEAFDAVIWATSSSNAASALMESAQAAPETIADSLRQWSTTAEALRFEAIATVYSYAPDAALSRPMVALRDDADHPAQFVFDRGQLDGTRGLLAFVVSASDGDKETLERRVLAQARTQLGLELAPVQTVIEKRATFACTPALQRPGQAVAPGLWACGDYIAGPYPATLEGATRSGMAAAESLGTA